MKEENIIQCFKNKNCKECPSNEDCNKELKIPKKKKREYIYIDLSNFYKNKKESG